MKARPLAACLLVVAGLVYSGQRLIRYYSTEKENWRDAVAFIASEARPNDRIITGIYFVEDAFSYYRHNWPPGVSIHPGLYSEEGFLSISNSERRVWYVTAFWHDLPPWLTQRLHEEYTSIATFEGDSPIYVYRKDPTPR